MRPAIEFFLSDRYGNPPHQGGGVVIAAEHQTPCQLEQELKQTYGKRLIKLVHKHAQNKPNP